MFNSVNNAHKAIITTIIAIIFYNEYLVYVINIYSWPQLLCKNELTCLKILLVSDPQLIGEKNEVYHFATPLTIWDSDRYLAKSYSAVVKYVNPNVVIFLGDLFDEGLIATRVQFHRYTKRLLNIFDSSYPIQHIWLPGDNDIGGEMEDVSSEKLKIFNETFVQPQSINIKFIQFTKINRMMSEFSFNFDINYRNKTSVILSHMPLALVPSVFIEKIFDVLRPKLIFSGHEHKSMIVETNKFQDYRKITKIKTNDSKIYSFQLTDGIIREVIVPTCSYRMGTDEIGYGAAIIEETGQVKYAVLWSPRRFTYLYIYFYVVVFLCLVFLYYTMKQCKKEQTVPKYGYAYYRYKRIKNGV